MTRMSFQCNDPEGDWIHEQMRRYVNTRNIRKLSYEELQRAIREDAMPVEQFLAMWEELKRRDYERDEHRAP